MDLATIASFLSALAAIGAVIASIRNAKKIQEVHISINSRMDELLKLKGEAGMAEGLEKGRNELRPK
jgi:hypothetical protein